MLENFQKSDLPVSGQLYASLFDKSENDVKWTINIVPTFL